MTGMDCRTGRALAVLALLMIGGLLLSVVLSAVVAGFRLSPGLPVWTTLRQYVALLSCKTCLRLSLRHC